MDSLVPHEEIARANVLIRLDYMLTRTAQSMKLPLTNDRTLLFNALPDVREHYKKHVDGTAGELRKLREKLVDRHIRIYANTYYHAQYAYGINLVRSALLAFIAWPPQLSVIDKLVKPGAYISISFIPTKLSNGKIHKPLIAKYTYSKFTLVSRYHLKKFLESHLRLRLFYYKKLQQYMDQGKTESHAKKLARRDVLRVIIGNIWLVQVYYLVKHGFLKPRDIVLPYWLADKPHLHDMIDPVDTADLVYIKNEELFHDLKNNNISWRWLIHEVLPA